MRLELLGGAIMAVIFAIFAAVAMGAYVVAMMARVVLLWVLIIMSPLAFIWQVLPATQGYAERWWKEFKEQVLVAPIMVFFLWLTFATLGTGTVIRDIQDGQGGKSSVIPLQNEASDEMAVSLSKISSWERMASFLVAIAFLFIGIKEVGETGAVGSRIIGNAVDFGKKVATVATGFGAAKFLAGKGSSLVGSALMAPVSGAGWLAKKGMWHVAGKHIVNKAKTTYAAAADLYYKQGGKMTAKGYQLRNDAGAKTAELVQEKELLSKETDPGKRAEREKKVEELDTQLEDIQTQMQGEYAGGFIGKSARRGIQYEKQLAKTEKQMENSKKLLWKSVGSEAGGKVLFGMGVGTGSRGLGFMPLQDKIEDLVKKGLTSVGGVTRTQKIADIDTEIEQKKTKGGDTARLEKKKQKLEEERAESGEFSWGRRLATHMGKRANFFRFGADQFEFDEDLAKTVYGEKGITAKDRVERGWLKAEEARSGAKDEEFESLGEKQALYRPRAKYDVKNGKFGWQATKGGMMDQIAQHKVGAEVHQDAIKLANSQARMKIVAEFDARTKQGAGLDTREAELEKKLEEAGSITETSLADQIKQLEGRIGGIDTEREERAEALVKAQKDAEKNLPERDEKIKALDAVIEKAGADSDEGKKAAAEKEELEAKNKKEADNIQGINDHIAGLDEEKKKILGGEEESGTLALLEAELKDLESIIGSGDEAIRQKLGDIDNDILAEQDKLKAADASLATVAGRRGKAQAESAALAADPEKAKKVESIQQKIEELERRKKEVEKMKGGSARNRLRRNITAQLEGKEGEVTIVVKDPKTGEMKDTIVQGGLYDALKNAKGPAAKNQQELERIQKEEDEAKKQKQEAEKSIADKTHRREIIEKKDTGWYTTEIGGLKDRLHGIDDEKEREKLGKLQGQLAVVRGGDVGQIEAKIVELKEKDDPESKLELEKLEKQLAEIKDPTRLDDAAKAERAGRLQQVHEATVAPLKQELAEVRAKKSDLKRKAQKLPSGVTYDDFLHTKSKAGHIAHILEQDEDRLFHEFEKKEYKGALDLDQAAKDVNRGKFDPRSKKFEEERKVLQTQFDDRRSKGTVGTLDEQRLALEKQRKDATEELAGIERPLKQIEAEIKKMEELEKKLTEEFDKDKTTPERKEEILPILDKIREEKESKQVDLAKVAGGTDEERAKVAARREVLGTTIKQKDDDIIKARTEIRAAEDNMRKTDPAYARLERQLREKNKQIDEVKDEDWKVKGERLRNGDTSVAHEVIHEIDHQIQTATGNKDVEEVNRLTKEKAQWEELEHHLPDTSLAWRFGVSKAKQEDTTKGYKYAHNLLLSESEQRSVYDERGLDVPKTTLTELIEQSSKSFGEMSIDSFVANVGPMLTSMIKKKKAGTLTEQDKAGLMGLFKRGMDRSWLDDAIYAIRNNKEAKEQIGDKLGWKDNIYTDDKIRDIQMLFATADVDFVKKNATMSYFQDVGENEFGMKQGEINEGIRTGVFKNKAGKDITAEFKGKVDGLIESNGFDQTDEHKQLFDSIFASTMGYDQQKLDEMQKLRTRALNDYLETTRKNQSEFQFLGNLRTDALKSGHVENAGYALAREVGGGESLYMGMGVRSARRHVMGDARKMDLRNRAGMQSHSFGYLDEDNGQVITEIHQDKFGDLMNGVDPRTWNAVNPRMRVHMMGLSSSDKFGSYRDTDDSFYVSRMTNSDGTQTNAAKTWNTKLSKDKKFSGHWQRAKTQNDQEGLIATAQMNRVFAREMRGSMSAFVMAAAEASGGNATNAAMDGNINFKIFNPKKGTAKLYQNVNQLIADYNKGDWSMDGELPVERINNFIPTDPANRTKVKATYDDLG